MRFPGSGAQPLRRSLMVVCTLGDLLLDVIVRREGSIAAGGEAEAQTRVGAGGQAANVAAWARELGAEARFVGKRADDAAGELAAGELARRGVDLYGPVANGRNGVVVSLVGNDGTRTMLSDRGVAPELSPEEVDVRWLHGCDWLHLAGYSLYRRPIDEAAAKAAGAVRVQGGRISVDLSSAAAIEAFGAAALRARLALLEPDIAFANEEEHRALGGAPPAATFVVKRGAAGIVVRRGSSDETLAAAPTTVLDTTGAGDALAAGFLVGGPELGLAAAARCVARLGAMP
ncbi:MAG: carbohydrate kinase family protein [Thermoleophilia bacterium]|nr:carbohydrate kinase family protein [Thermoleophilia bacterium]